MCIVLRKCWNLDYLLGSLLIIAEDIFLQCDCFLWKGRRKVWKSSGHNMHPPGWDRINWSTKTLVGNCPPMSYVPESIVDLFTCILVQFDSGLRCSRSIYWDFRLESVQDFLIKLDMKPGMQWKYVRIFSLNHVIVRLTKIVNNLLENLKIHTS